MLSILLVAYKPDIKKLNFLIKSIDKKYKIIIINNSEIKLKNLNIIDKQVKIINSKNNGNGAAINLGLKYCKTSLVIYMDLDIKIQKKFFKKFIKIAKNIKNFCILVPNHGNLYDKRNIIEKYSGEASVMMFNLKKIKQTSLFDENFFLYFEEEDLFHRCKKSLFKVYFVKNLMIKHDRATSVSKSVKNLKNIRSWHYMWSMFYFYKKNYNYFYGLKKVIKLLIIDSLMCFFYSITLNYDSSINRFYRIYGLLASLLGFKSFLRP